jgi:prepilin-type N-terminal cleavage/methylation domain-containing protein
MGASTHDQRDLAGDRSPVRRGFTLIEITVVLAVIVTLALVLTPSIANFINDSRVTRANNDCNTIAGAIVQFYKDNGFFPQWRVAGNGGPGAAGSRLDLLVSAGNIPVIDPAAGVVGGLAFSGWLNGRAETLAGQLISNAPGYTVKTPASQFGWNGPYVSSVLGPDPWNNRYMVNIGQIEVAPGFSGGGPPVKNAVWVISAGPNGIIETSFSQAVTNAAWGGDDIARRIQ